MVKVESDDEAEEDIKNDIVADINIPIKTNNVKRKLPINGDKNNKLKPTIKKKKSISNNWEVSENV